MILLADVAMMPIIEFNPIVGLLMLSVPILIEWFVLRRLGWESRRALFDATIINLVSTLVGMVVILMLPSRFDGCNVLECMTSLLQWGDLLFLWVSTVVIEGVALTIMYRKNIKHLWKSSLLINVASYVLMSPIFMFFIGNRLQ
jgi:hypothetical protein